jgi:hypothetical protein
MLNLNGSLSKAGVMYSTLGSEDFTDAFFLKGLRVWLLISHPTRPAPSSRSETAFAVVTLIPLKSNEHLPAIGV